MSVNREKFSLTQKQRDIMDYIVKIKENTGVTPTQRDISQQFGIAQATVAKHLQSIERRGWIQRAKGFKNGMTIL